MDAPSQLTWPTASEDNLYTLIMLDPDAPSRHRPRPGAALHWMVANIPGTHVDQGTQLASYLGAGPPENSGLHRYPYVVCWTVVVCYCYRHVIVVYYCYRYLFILSFMKWRYVFAIYKQGGRVDVTDKNVAKNWSLSGRRGQYIAPLLQR